MRTPNLVTTLCTLLVAFSSACAGQDKSVSDLRDLFSGKLPDWQEKPAPVTGRMYVVLVSSNNPQWLEVSGAGPLGLAGVSIGRAKYATQLFVIDSINEKKTDQFKSGSKVRIRGINRDPWLVMQSGGPGPLIGHRGDPPVGTEFELVKLDTSKSDLISLLDDVMIKETAGHGWLYVDNGRVYAAQDKSKAHAFRFRSTEAPAHQPPDPDEEGDCICHFELTINGNSESWRNTTHTCGRSSCESYCREVQYSYPEWKPNITQIEYHGGGSNCH